MSNLTLIKNEVEGCQQQFINVSVDEQIKFEREAQFALQIISSNAYTMSLAMSNKASLKNAILNLSAIGITLNPAQKLCYLVPRNKSIVLDISYMGLMHIAQQTGAITWCQSQIVRANDKFEILGVDIAPRHTYNPFDTAEQRGDIVGAYVVVKTQDGDYLTHTMRIQDVFAIRDRSESFKSVKAGRAKTCPWITDEEQMILKTVVKQASKYWPRRDRLDKAIDYINTDGGEGIDFASEQGKVKDITPATEEQLIAIEVGLADTKSKFSVIAEKSKSIFGRELKTPLDLTQEEAKKLLVMIDAKKAKLSSKKEGSENAA